MLKTLSDSFEKCIQENYPANFVTFNKALETAERILQFNELPPPPNQAILTRLKQLRNGMIHGCFMLTDENNRGAVENFLSTIAPMVHNALNAASPGVGSESKVEEINEVQIIRQIEEHALWKLYTPSVLRGPGAFVDYIFQMNSAFLPSLAYAQLHPNTISYINRVLSYYAEGLINSTPLPGSNSEALYYVQALSELAFVLSQTVKPTEKFKQYGTPKYDGFRFFHSQLSPLQKHAIEIFKKARLELIHNPVGFTNAQLINFKNSMGAAIPYFLVQPGGQQGFRDWVYDVCAGKDQNRQGLQSFREWVRTHANDPALAPNLMLMLNEADKEERLMSILDSLLFTQINDLKNCVTQLNDVAYTGLETMIDQFYFSAYLNENYQTNPQAVHDQLEKICSADNNQEKQFLVDALDYIRQKDQDKIEEILNALSYDALTSLQRLLYTPQFYTENYHSLIDTVDKLALAAYLNENYQTHPQHVCDCLIARCIRSDFDKKTLADALNYIGNTQANQDGSIPILNILNTLSLSAHDSLRAMLLSPPCNGLDYQDLRATAKIAQLAALENNGGENLRVHVHIMCTEGTDLMKKNLIDTLISLEPAKQTSILGTLTEKETSVLRTVLTPDKFETKDYSVLLNKLPDPQMLESQQFASAHPVPLSPEEPSSSPQAEQLTKLKEKLEGTPKPHDQESIQAPFVPAASEQKQSLEASKPLAGSMPPPEELPPNKKRSRSPSGSGSDDG
ncbi:MAG TPA: hypothetical protein VNK03_03860 [Gammaproteobacteria bacterium]|nr:hypothetical protein [Gammaproteobacteria bacterium]